MLLPHWLPFSPPSGSALLSPWSRHGIELWVLIPRAALEPDLQHGCVLVSSMVLFDTVSSVGWVFCRQEKVFIFVLYISATYKSKNATKSPRYHKIRECKMCCGALRWSIPDRSVCPLEKQYERVQCTAETQGWILLPEFPLKSGCKFCSRWSRKGQWLEGTTTGMEI